MNNLHPKIWKSYPRQSLKRNQQMAKNLVKWMNLCLRSVLYQRKRLSLLLEKVEIPKKLTWAELMNSSKFLRVKGYSIKIQCPTSSKIPTFWTVKPPWPKSVEVTQGNQPAVCSKLHPKKTTSSLNPSVVTVLIHHHWTTLPIRL